MPAQTMKKGPKKVGKSARRTAPQSAPKRAPGSAQKSAPTRASPKGAQRPLQEQVRPALSSLKQMSTQHEPREPGAVRHHREQGLGCVDGQPAGAGQAPGAQPRAGRRPLGDRLVRGPHAGLVGRRAGTGHARADGPLVPRLRQLGNLRQPRAFACSTARRTPGTRWRSGATGATSSPSARPLRCSPVSPGTTRAPPTSASPVACRSSSALPATNETSSRRV